MPTKMIRKAAFLLKSQLTYKLIFICLLIFVFQCGVILYSYSNIAGSKKAEVISQNVKLLQQANNNYLSDIVKQIDELMGRVFVQSIFWEDITQTMGVEDYVSDNSKMNQILSGMYNYGSSIDSLYLYLNKNDNLYIMDELSHEDIPSGKFSNNTFMLHNPDMKSFAWYKGAIKNKGNLIISRTTNIREKENPNGKYELNFSKSLFDPLNNHELIAVISININYQFFEKLTDELGNKGEKIMIVKDDGTIIFSTDPSEIFHQADASLRQKMISGKSPWFMTGSFNNESIVLYNKSIGSGWYMVKEIPYSQLMKDVRKTIITNLSLTLSIFIIGIALIMLITIRITFSIKKIANVMEKFEEGDGKFTLFQDRSDEIGKLNNSFNKMVDRINNLILSEYKTTIKEKQARLEALQAQINPHFLNNTLQIISSIAVEKNVPDIEKINNALSTILRYSLSKNNQHVTLNEEIKHVENYMFIQKYRFGERIRFEVQIADEFVDCLIPVLALQTIFENSMKHGMEQKVGNGFIRFWSEPISDEMFMLIVEDNGNGMTSEAVDTLNEKLIGAFREENSGWSGRGLINVHDRIRYYHGEKYGLRVKSEYGKWMRVIIKLPR